MAQSGLWLEFSKGTFNRIQKSWVDAKLEYSYQACVNQRGYPGSKMQTQERRENQGIGSVVPHPYFLD